MVLSENHVIVLLEYHEINLSIKIIVLLEYHEINLSIKIIVLLEYHEIHGILRNT